MTEELEFQRQVETNFRWNFAVNTLDLSFYTFGFTLVSQATVLPLLVSQLTSSKLLIGLIPATYSLGYLLPQLLTANFTESLRRKLPFLTLVGGLVERTPFLWIGLTNTLLAPAKTLSPILGGWLATLVGYSPMFLVALVVSVLGGLLYSAWVHEPRHTPHLGGQAN